MKIYGIGVDIAKGNRFKKIIKNNKIISRLFNQIEIKKCKKVLNKENCYAKKFAAKEAFSKALGNGISGNVKFSDIEIMRDLKGKPYINLQNKLKKIVTNLGITKSHVSLADEKKYAIAFVILEK